MEIHQTNDPQIDEKEETTRTEKTFEKMIEQKEGEGQARKRAERAGRHYKIKDRR